MRGTRERLKSKFVVYIFMCEGGLVKGHNSISESDAGLEFERFEKCLKILSIEYN